MRVLQEKKWSRRRDKRELAALHQALASAERLGPRSASSSLSSTLSPLEARQGFLAPANGSNYDSSQKGRQDEQPCTVEVEIKTVGGRRTDADDFSRFGDDKGDTTNVGGDNASIDVRQNEDTEERPNVDVPPEGGCLSPASVGLTMTAEELLPIALEGNSQEARTSVAVETQGLLGKSKTVRSSASTECATNPNRTPDGGSLSTASRVALLVRMGLVRARLGSSSGRGDGGLRPVAESLWHEVEELAKSGREGLV